MNIIKLRTPYQIRVESERVENQRAFCIRVMIACSILGGICLLLMTGCSTAQGPISHAAFTAAVTIGEQIALETHPEATPYLRIAVPVVCSVANGTNVSPAAIVAALEAANVTNRTTRLIINSSLTLFNVVITGATNQSEVRVYAQDLCNGMISGLPPTGRERALVGHRPSKPLPPHLQ